MAIVSEINSSLQPLTHHFSSLSSIISLLLPKHVIISICGKTKYAAPYSILSTLHFKTHCFRFLPSACCYLLPFCSTFVCLFVCLFACLLVSLFVCCYYAAPLTFVRSSLTAPAPSSLSTFAVVWQNRLFQ